MRPVQRGADAVQAGPGPRGGVHPGRHRAQHGRRRAGSGAARGAGRVAHLLDRQLGPGLGQRDPQARQLHAQSHPRRARGLVLGLVRLPQPAEIPDCVDAVHGQQLGGSQNTGPARLGLGSQGQDVQRPGSLAAGRLESTRVQFARLGLGPGARVYQGDHQGAEQRVPGHKRAMH